MKPVVLIVMDGVGLSPETQGNAVALANKPNLQYISRNYPGTALHASGIEVGLPWGEVGSSQVGHANIGAGLVVYQNLPRVTLAIESGTFFKMPVWKETIEHVQKNNSAIHLMGMVSSGGVHSHINHLKAILEVVAQNKFRGKVYVHFFSDGQDVPPKTALKFLADLEAAMKKTGIGKIATLMGKKYAMDRDDNWDLTQQAFDCLTAGKGAAATSAEEAVKNAYQNGIGDEDIPPSIIDREGVVKENDALIFFNFRPDRARQITETFFQKMPGLFFATMTQYRENYPVKVAFPSQVIKEPLGKIISDAGKTQIRIAESEKQAHASYFLDGGQEKIFPGETRYFLPSPKTADFSKTPEMAARRLAESALEAIAQGYDFIFINFANGDLVGHTGNLEAVKKALETVDECVGKISKRVLEIGGAAIITADHGNAEEMINLETGEIDKEHSTNPVPLWVMTPSNKFPEKFAALQEPMKIMATGALMDAAPTVLELMGLRKAPEMEGQSLANIKTRQFI